MEERRSKEELLAALKTLNEKCKPCDPDKYWAAMRPIIEAEQKAFAEEDRRMTPSWEQMNRPFTI